MVSWHEPGPGALSARPMRPRRLSAHAGRMDFPTVADDLQGRLGLTAHVHALDLASGAEVGLRADDAVVAASVFKVPVLVEVCRQVAEGERAATDRVELGPDEFRVLGPTGLSVTSDAVSLSLRDLYLSMMTVSDNRATDVVLDLVGLDRVNGTMAGLGLPGTVLEGDCRHLFAQLAEDLGAGSVEELEDSPRMLSSDVLNTRPLDPHRSNRTTSRETTALLRRIWTGDGLPEDACTEARRILGLQVWPHRLRSGFDDSVKVSGKTGTLAAVRNEAGVVEFPDGGRYAVAVFLRLDTPASVAPDVDRAIGTLAAAAVADLRG